MNRLAYETQNVQNPALGAALIWRFCCGFQQANVVSMRLSMSLVCLVLPVTLHYTTAEFVRSTRKSSGLRAFAAKFGESKNAKQDVLLQIHDRMVRWRTLSMQSLELAVAGHLVNVDGFGNVLPLSTTPIKGISKDIQQLLTVAEKLGYWCGQLTPHEVAATLKVRI